jgi:hypothetical protein
MSEKKARLNWAHWKRMDEWSMSQALCLMVGVTPDSWFGKKIGRGERSSLELSGAQAELSDRAREIFDLIWASHNQRKLTPEGHPFATSPEAMAPGRWVYWARSKGIQLPMELTDVADVVGVADSRTLSVTSQISSALDGEAAKQASTSDRISSRDLSTLYRLILGMAVASYDYRVSDNKSHVPKKIETDLRTVKLDVGHDTILKWLRKAAAHLEYQDDKPNSNNKT